VANCYVVNSPNRNAYVIDPGGNATEILAHLNKGHLKVLGYLVTHGHNDHIKGLPQLIQHLPASAGINTNDVPLYAKRMGDAGPFDLFLQDGRNYGTNTLSFTVIHTPGHSPGGVCLYFKQAGVLFTGDTLFEDGTGRTDLDGGEAAALQASLKKLTRLPQQTALFSGHGGKTTLQVALRRNGIPR